MKSVKVQVKSLKIENNQKGSTQDQINEKSGENDTNDIPQTYSTSACNYQIRFELMDKLPSAEGWYFDDTVTPPTLLKFPNELNVPKDMFVFISQHSKEYFQIEFDKNNELTSVELIYG